MVAEIENQNTEENVKKKKSYVIPGTGFSY